MAEQPWYHEGLKFQCSGCGNCCTGAPGYVWVNKQEIAAMADRMNLEMAEFERRYIRNVGIRKSLIELAEANWDCVFLDKDRNCTVYDVRPRQCRTWPFWDSNVRTPQKWQETCEICPGCDKGDIVPVEEIELRIVEIRI